MQSSVNSRLPPVPVLDKHGHPKRVKGKLVTISPSRWLDQNRPVEQMTWCPGFPMLIKDRLVVDGGWIERPEVTCFNHYRPPRIELGDASKAGPWLDHVRKIYPEDADHTITWLAHRVQRPQEKINHALVLGGLQGIGKDTLLERFPILPGVERLIILVDHDFVGKAAAACCAERWSRAGRAVVRLTPKRAGADFNDLVMPEPVS